MSAAFLTNPLVLDALVKARPAVRVELDARPLGTRLPDSVRNWLARLRLLEGVPFSYFVPDTELLPPESIRFFYVDRAWTDALVEGALSAGTINTLDRQQMETVYPRVRDDVDAAERQLRVPPGEKTPAFDQANTISGFLLRSAAVSGWPALHVRAYSEDIWGDDALIDEDHPSRVQLLRLERLAPAVLFCLFDGIPQLVHVEEPRQGVQFGVDVPSGATDTRRASVKRRDLNGNLVAAAAPVSIPFRAGSPGVLHIKNLAADFAATNSAELAVQLLQFPYRQVFGEPSFVIMFPDLFTPSVGIETVRDWLRIDR